MGRNRKIERYRLGDMLPGEPFYFVVDYGTESVISEYDYPKKPKNRDSNKQYISLADEYLYVFRNHKSQSQYKRVYISRNVTVIPCNIAKVARRLAYRAKKKS